MTSNNDEKIEVSNNDEAAPLEELTSDSTGSGLEAEPLDDAGEIRAPFDPKLIDVITHQRTVDLLMARLGHGELNLSPDFQRRANLWSEARKSGLIESILLRIPIPSLYVSEDKDGNYEVVDGLQRLCAIAHFVRVSGLNKALNTKLAPLRLTGLQSLKNELDHKAFDDLPRPLHRRIMETELTLHVIRFGTPANVKFNIFSRINQGGLPLKAQEIRNAIYTAGKWREHVRRMAITKDFLSATEGKIKGERLEDHELVLRFAALFSLPSDEKRHPDENLEEFLNEFVDKRAVGWNDQKWQETEAAFDRAMKSAPRVFGRMAFRKYSKPNEARRPINRGLFETEAVALAQRPDIEINALAERSDQVIEKFGQKFSGDNDFANALLYATGKGWASNKRLEVINAIFEEVLHA
ncbi:DUF262 domain-containing protein [Aromatoleum bremense]|uniref:DUF262 domain-containing protein n=1 Tax=Aromatoleum bremense TaxID=76115 RepID=A0ABX1NS18_9RHOO|nr:DUF262 domain-containing protein [Aromatoleum bremense]NMG14476.1 DUF262 domain-containing protein [Aromatoleum bremense]QTQ30810.1 putative protein DUF262 [Aromatoleum bremense]